MADKIRYDVSVDAGDAKRGLQDFSRAAKKAGKDAADAFDDTATAGDKARAALVAMSKSMDTELRSAAKAAKALGDALGPELAGRMDLDQVVDGLNRMGVSFEEITADADKFAGTLKEIDGTRVEQINDGLGHTRQNTDDLSDSARGAHSALANMIGNSAQDLGQLGGVAGSAGVAIGQMAEYAADATLAGEGLGSALRSMAGIVGPIAALTAGIQIVSRVMGGFSDRAAFTEEHLQRLNDIMAEGGDVIGNYAAAMADVGTETTDAQQSFLGFAGQFFNMNDGIVDVTDSLDAAGVTLREFARGVSGTRDDANRLQAMFDAAADSGAITQAQWEQLTSALAQLRNQWGVTADGVSKANRLMATSTEDVNDALDALTAQQNPLSQLFNQSVQLGGAAIDAGIAWTELVKDLADGHADLEDTGALVTQFADLLHLSTDDVIALAVAQGDGTKAMAGYQTAVEGVVDAGTDLQQVTERIHDLQMAALEFDPAATRADAFATALAKINAASEVSQSQKIIAASEAIDTFGQALRDAAEGGVDFANVDFIPDNWDEVRNMGDDVKGVVDAFAGMRDQIQTELSDAFNIGGLPAFNEHLATIRQAVFDQLKAAGITGGQALIDALEALGLDDQSIQILMEVTGDEEAKHKIDTILGAVGDLPPSVVLAVTAKAETDPQGALQYLIDWFAGEGVTIPVELQPNVDGPRLKKDAKAVADDAFGALHPEVIAKLKADVKAAKQSIADTTVPREVKITPTIIAKTTAGDIDKIAKPRTAPVNVTDNGTATATNKQINYAARNRDTYVYVHTVPVGGGGGGGGPTPIPDTAAATTATTAAVAPTQTLSPTPMRVEVVNQTTAPAPINVTITSGVLGNHFDVERTVARALRRYQRVNGRR